MPAEVRLIDTNVLIYAYDRSDESRHEIAWRIVESVWRDGGGAVALQNLAEFFVVVTSASKVEFPMPAADARTIVSDVIRSTNWLKIDRQAGTMLTAMDLSGRAGVHFWDAMISACMLEQGIRTILTENVKDFRKVPGLVVVNPFA